MFLLSQQNKSYNCVADSTLSQLTERRMASGFFSESFLDELNSRKNKITEEIETKLGEKSKLEEEKSKIEMKLTSVESSLKSLKSEKADLTKHVEEFVTSTRTLLARPGSTVVEEETSYSSMMDTGDTVARSGQNDGMQYNVGDFVLINPSKPGIEPQIFMVERLFEKDGANSIWGAQFFRQRETFHVPTRTFYEAEVMKGDLHQAIPISSVMGKCYVMPVKDYCKFKPEGFDEKDIFVAEWKYTSKQRNWKKIKPTGFWEAPDHIKIVPRETALEPKRVPSVFKDRIEKHKEEIEELEALEKVVEDDPVENVGWVRDGSEDGLTYWEQYTIPGPITLRRGDHVLVRGENNRNMIAQIDTMWTGRWSSSNMTS